MPQSEDFSICWNGRINHELVKKSGQGHGAWDHWWCYAYVVLTKKNQKRRSALKSKEIEGENSIQEANALRR